MEKYQHMDKDMALAELDRLQQEYLRLKTEYEQTVQKQGPNTFMARDIHRAWMEVRDARFDIQGLCYRRGWFES